MYETDQNAATVTCARRPGPHCLRPADAKARSMASRVGVRRPGSGEYETRGRAGLGGLVPDTAAPQSPRPTMDVELWTRHFHVDHSSARLGSARLGLCSAFSSLLSSSWHPGSGCRDRGAAMSAGA